MTQKAQKTKFVHSTSSLKKSKVKNLQFNQTFYSSKEKNVSRFFGNKSWTTNFSLSSHKKLKQHEKSIKTKSFSLMLLKLNFQLNIIKVEKCLSRNGKCRIENEKVKREWKVNEKQAAFCVILQFLKKFLINSQ